ncbi:hypothetical protein MN608_03139 [Microdochium nivale]|nr:hypothetical protein MN608_03139 [Microdochium nivale]
MDDRSAQSLDTFAAFDLPPADTADLDAWLSSWAAESTRPPTTADLGATAIPVSPRAQAFADTPVRGGTPVHHHRPWPAAVQPRGRQPSRPRTPAAAPGRFPQLVSDTRKLWP